MREQLCMSLLLFLFRWEFIKCLNQLQTEEGLRAGNSLKTSHVEWKRQQMKVNLAVQVISRSVSDAIAYCREDLKLQQFQGSEATCHFLKQFDLLFDIMNSKNLLGKGFKSPMKTSNELYWKPQFVSAASYILGLKTLTGMQIVRSPRKAGFLGFLCNLKAFTSLFENCVTNGPLDFLLTFKFSQDHIELLFCALRTRLGSNNNPSAKEFQYAYKRLLLHQEIRGSRGNCIVDPDSFLLPIKSLQCTSDPPASKDFQSSKSLQPLKTDHDYSILSHWPILSEYQSSVIEYIAGFCVKMSMKLIKCNVCLQAVTEETNNKKYQLVNRKDRGGLIHANSSVRVVCQETEKAVKKLFILCDGQIPTIKDIKLLVTTSVLQQVL